MKVFVISNGCLTNNTSNGRALLSLLKNVECSDILNFFMNSAGYDESLKMKSIQVTDGQALKSFISLGLKKPSGVVSIPQSSESIKDTPKKIQKSAFKMNIRNMVWNSNFWFSKSLKNQIKEFSPDIVLLQVGDLPYHYKFARKISETYSIPLVIYSTEDYALKDYDYIKGISKKTFWFNHLHSKQFKELKKAYSVSKLNVFNSELLKDETCKYFDVKNANVFYMGSDLTPVEKHDNDINEIIYAGNLGLGREDSLIEMAKVLEKSGKKIKYYGVIQTPEIQSKINTAKNIECCGFVPYEKLKDIIHNSDLILHVESFDNYYQKDLRFSFSTKIADSLCSGVPFFMYAPKNMAGTDYVLSVNNSLVALNREDMENKLSSILKGDFKYSPDFNKILENHNAKKSSEIFYKLMEEIR